MVKCEVKEMTLPAELRGHRLLRVRPAQRRRPSVVSSSQLALHNGEVTTNNVVGKDEKKNVRRRRLLRLRQIDR
jgi:hypothetical protein